jgi:hypothetical protein
VLVASGIVLVANGPWLAWFASVYHGSRAAEVFSPGHFWQFCGHYLGLLAKNVFPPLLLLVPVVVGAVCWLRRKALPAVAPSLWQNLALLVLFLVITLMAVSRAAPEPYFRYLGPLIPVCAAMIALLAEWCMKSHLLAGGVLVLLVAIKQPIPNYLYEITHDYDGPIEGIVRYLQDRARPADVVAITYGDLPVKFYTNLRVVGGLTGEDLSPAKEADWIICRKYYVTKLDLAVRNYLMANIDWTKYRRVELDYPDIPFENREEPQLHQYRTVTNAPRVVVYEKIR